jgi:hypothetical protein
VLIQSQTANASANLTFNTGITYNEYILRISNLESSVDGASLFCTLSTDGGGTFLAANYISNVFNFRMDASGIGLATETTDKWYLSQVVNSATTQSGQYYLSNMLTGNPGINGQITPFTSTFEYGSITFGRQSTGAINAIRIAPSSGNISQGTFKLYGVQS